MCFDGSGTHRGRSAGQAGGGEKRERAVRELNAWEQVRQQGHEVGAWVQRAVGGTCESDANQGRSDQRWDGWADGRTYRVQAERP